MPKVSADLRDEYLQERRDQILAAAVKEFGRKGYSGTSVSDIAQAANIAKGTIYLYFKSKEDIFTAILTESSFLPELADLAENVQAPPAEILAAIANQYLTYMKEYYPILRMVLADSHKFPAHKEKVYREVILKANQVLANYLVSQQEQGRIRLMENPLLTARAFWGMLIVYILTQEILGGNTFLPIDQKAWVREIIQVFLDGVKA